MTTEAKIQTAVMLGSVAVAAILTYVAIRLADVGPRTTQIALVLAVAGNLIMSVLAWRALQGHRPLFARKTSAVLSGITWIALALAFAPRLIAAAARGSPDARNLPSHDGREGFCMSGYRAQPSWALRLRHVPRLGWLLRSRDCDAGENALWGGTHRRTGRLCGGRLLLGRSGRAWTCGVLPSWIPLTTGAGEHATRLRPDPHGAYCASRRG